MKQILFIIILFTITISCKKEIPVTDPTMDLVSFEGTWSRQFDVIGSIHTATYKINNNEIQYNLEGLHNTEYTLQKDSYNKKEGRWIGHTTENQYYFLFFKGVLEEKITIYKQKVNDPNSAQNITIPSEDTEENYGWNVYDLK